MFPPGPQGGQFPRLYLLFGRAVRAGQDPPSRFSAVWLLARGRVSGLCGQRLHWREVLPGALPGLAASRHVSL